MTAAPVPSPRGASKGRSSKRAGSIWQTFTILANSRVVMERSTSLPASASFTASTAHSYFLAVQGMTETQKIFLGSTPIFSAKYVFVTAPNICWGLFAVERFFASSGCFIFTYLTQPGQQEVNMGMGYSPGWVILWMNSLPSSIMVRSAEKLVSNT